MTTWLDGPCRAEDRAAAAEASARQTRLTKPAGSLGRLEDLAIRLSGLQGVSSPSLDHVHIAVFAADHGVAAEGVSAFPQRVTSQMVANFAAGGAAISVLAHRLQAKLEVIDVGTVGTGSVPFGVVDARVRAGSGNIRYQDAMSEAELAAALAVGRRAVQRAAKWGAQLFIGGEMGIGNTTAATAMGCALLGADPADLAGPGTGLGAEGVAHKAAVINSALRLHRASGQPPLVILRRLGGLEIAALTGAYVSAAQLGVPVLVDGFIATAAAMVAVYCNPAVRSWMLFSHRSAEPGHAAMLDALAADPVLDLGMRLGEGSGAAVAVPLLRLACALHNDMATFSDAGIAEH